MTKAVLDIDSDLWKQGRKYAIDHDLTNNELVSIALASLLAKEGYPAPRSIPLGTELPPNQPGKLFYSSRPFTPAPKGKK